MIAKEGFPRLDRSTSPGHHVFRDRRLGNVEAELEQLTMNLGGTPERVLATDPANEVAYQPTCASFVAAISSKRNVKNGSIATSQIFEIPGLADLS
jgi:hypothetical protein